MWYMVVASTAEVTVDTGPEPEVVMIVVPFGWCIDTLGSVGSCR